MEVVDRKWRCEGLTLCCLAYDCSTAVRKPFGKVKPDSQKRVGGVIVAAQRANWSTRWHRSRVQEESGFREG